MSKIAVFDSNSGKFTNEMMAYWRDQGHEVNYAYGYDPSLANTSDVTWIDVCDYNALVATTGVGQGDDWIFKGKKLVIRAIDIDVWAGHYMNVDWSKVSDVVFIAKHIMDLALSQVDFESFGTKVHLIPCGVDTDKYPPRRDPTNTFKIAYVAELWHAKGVDMMLQIATMLPDHYQIQVVGKNCLEPWYWAWLNYFMKQHNLEGKVKFIDWVDDMNEFLEDKTFVLCCSKKEAFSYAVAEGASKGCKPIIFDFQGSRDIWPESWIFETSSQAVDMIVDYPRDPESYIKFINENYKLSIMMERINAVCGLESRPV